MVLLPTCPALVLLIAAALVAVAFSPADACDCGYVANKAGCLIKRAAQPGHVCKCVYQGNHVCGGIERDCTAEQAGLEKCRIPDTSFEACLLARGDCVGYERNP